MVLCFVGVSIEVNRPFPSSLVPLFQNESKCETFHMKMSSACSFILMQSKVIFIRMVSHLDSLWNRGTRELGNGLSKSCKSSKAMSTLKIIELNFVKLFSLVLISSSGQFYAHTHRDDFHLQILDATDEEAEKASTKSFVIMTASISPVYSNNPAFKVYTLSTDKQALVDYDQYYLDLVIATGKKNPPERWSS